MPEPDALDLFRVDTQLSEDERLVRASVRRFVDHEVLPVIGRAFVEQRFPVELVPEMASLGLFGSTISDSESEPVSYTAYGVICEELERGDSALRSFASVQSSLVMGSIDRFGNAEQKDRWLPELRAGRAIGCFGLTEPQGGSDPGAMRTTARRVGEDWCLNGSKCWITNGHIADLAIVWARGEEGILGFLVERSTNGFTTREIEDKFSLRASSTGELFLDDARIPDASRLPHAQGLKAALGCLDQARYGIAWGALGAARACLEDVLGYVQDRELFGDVLAAKQSIQIRLADMARRLSTAQLLALRLGEIADAGESRPVQTSLAKWNNVRMALDLARECRDILGAAGITIDHPVIRHMLNLESVATYEGTQTIHALVVGRELTGRPAF
jgi:glutaryl-CoA dehydrogenase